MDFSAVFNFPLSWIFLKFDVINLRFRLLSYTTVYSTSSIGLLNFPGDWTGDEKLY